MNDIDFYSKFKKQSENQIQIIAIYMKNERNEQKWALSDVLYTI